MLKLSKMSDYAVIILTHMAFLKGEVLSAAHLAHSTQLPEPTVSKVLKLLSKHDLINSVRGTNGGYILKRMPEDISMAHVITATDGPIALTSCVDKAEGSCCDREHHCSIKGQWNPVNEAMQSALEKVSLRQMMRG